jgi:hypothetical protein
MTLKSDTPGTKKDQDKSRMDLIDPDFLEDIGYVMGFGAQKYAAHNWRNGIAVSRLVSAAFRHLAAINRGEEIDPETGKPHAAHLACNAMFLHWMPKARPDMDDRWRPVDKAQLLDQMIERKKNEEQLRRFYGESCEVSAGAREPANCRGDVLCSGIGRGIGRSNGEGKEVASGRQD